MWIRADRSKRVGKKKKVRQIGVKKKETPNWLDLPRDVMLSIFLRLDLIDLSNAESVCPSWQEIAADPLLNRRIHFCKPLIPSGPFQKTVYIAFYENLLMQAIERSRGQLVDFLVMHFPISKMLLRMVETGCRLKRLHLAHCNLICVDALIELVEKMPSLEAVELCMCLVSGYGERQGKLIEALGSARPELKSFRLNRKTYVYAPNLIMERLDDEALAIARTMPGLQSLHLFGNSMTNIGLQAILEKCRNLEYLDLRQCFHLDLSEDLLKKCQQIKILRLPHDSTDDYEFDKSVVRIDRILR